MKPSVQCLPVCDLVRRPLVRQDAEEVAVGAGVLPVLRRERDLLVAVVVLPHEVVEALDAALDHAPRAVAVVDACLALPDPKDKG